MPSYAFPSPVSVLGIEHARDVPDELCRQLVSSRQLGGHPLDGTDGLEAPAALDASLEVRLDIDAHCRREAAVEELLELGVVMSARATHRAEGSFT
jgi:hypothetical protein